MGVSVCVRARASVSLWSAYPVVICGVGVLVTGDDFWCHPVGRANEGVPPAHGPVQLGTHAKVHWGHTNKNTQKMIMSFHTRAVQLMIIIVIKKINSEYCFLRLRKQQI